MTSLESCYLKPYLVENKKQRADLAVKTRQMLSFLHPETPVLDCALYKPNQMYSNEPSPRVWRKFMTKLDADQKGIIRVALRRYVRVWREDLDQNRSATNPLNIEMSRDLTVGQLPFEARAIREQIGTQIPDGRQKYAYVDFQLKLLEELETEPELSRELFDSLTKSEQPVVVVNGQVVSSQETQTE